MAWAGTRGKALKVAKPAFPPRAPPFPGTQQLQAVGICEDIGGAMDSTTLAVEGRADLC